MSEALAAAVEPYVTINEIVHYLPISVTSIKRLCTDPRDPIPHVRLGRRYAFKLSSVMAWLDARSRASSTRS